MVPEKYSLAAIAQRLLAVFEVRRPGISRWDAETDERLRREADAALQQMEQQCRELGIDDPPHWQRARAVVHDALLPRYERLAEAENAAAARDYGMWRGGHSCPTRIRGGTADGTASASKRWCSTSLAKAPRSRLTARFPKCSRASDCAARQRRSRATTRRRPRRARAARGDSRCSSRFRE
jgi:hypothetical protein